MSQVNELVLKNKKANKSKSVRKNGSKKIKRRSRTACLWFIWLLHVVVDTIVDFIFRLLFVDDKNRRLITPIKHSFLVESATSLAEKIRSKQLSSKELVQRCIERIEEVNVDLNCVVDQRYKEALEEAKKVDELIASDTVSVEELKVKKPFLGVPFTNKESTHAAGLSCTFGIVARKGYKATEDADIVARMKEGGGILLAATNIPELNLWQETRNNIFGQTNNPYNVNRTVGGSSGGEAAAIAACASPLGLGTDIGGSVRMPCYFCGICGHKPTSGLISTKGMTYRTGEVTKTMVTAGTMTRYVEDIIPMLKLLLGENVKSLKLDTKVPLNTVRLCYVLDSGDRRVSALSGEVKSCVQRAVSHLEEQCGSPAKQLNLSGLSFSYALWRYWMSKEPGNFAFDLGNRKVEVSGVVELLKMLVGQSEYTLPAILKLLEAAIFPPVPARWAEETTEKLQQELLEELGDDGVLLLPSHPTTANPHYVPFFRPFNFAYWAVINVLHLPSTQVPLGLSRDGLPLGIQVVAGPYNDHLCIAVARELEKAFGGYVPPCPLDVSK